MKSLDTKSVVLGMLLMLGIATAFGFDSTPKPKHTFWDYSGDGDCINALQVQSFKKTIDEPRTNGRQETQITFVGGATLSVSLNGKVVRAGLDTTLGYY